MKTDHSNRWTTEQLIKFAALWAADVPIQEIVTEFGCSATAVRRLVVRLRQDGIPLKRRRAGNMAGKHSIPWTQEDVQYLIRRRNEGATGEQISIELNRTFGAIQCMVQAVRKSGASIKMFGSGRRRLWDVDKINAAAVMDNIIPIDRAKRVA